MVKVFVNGNPETPAIWSYLVRSLEARGVDDIVLLAPPGFGSPRPEGFSATQIAYRDWLIAEIEGLGGDVDLVGHDWGAGHTFGVLAERPDLLRTWAADCAGIVHPDYIWHDAAQAWQTPGVGEEIVAAMFGGDVAGRAELLTSLGVPTDVAAEVAGGLNDESGQCVLDLYRSGEQPALVDLGRRLRTTQQRPGLVLIATEDHHVGTPEMAAATASLLGASTLTLEGLHHWWMFDAADMVADRLVEHWAGVE